MTSRQPYLGDDGHVQDTAGDKLAKSVVNYASQAGRQGGYLLNADDFDIVRLQKRGKVRTSTC
jgi:hypothetical protein